MIKVSQLWRRVFAPKQNTVPERGTPQGGPRFYVSERQPIQPGAVLLAVVVAAAVLFGVTDALRHNGHIRMGNGESVSRSMSAASSGSSADDKDDDPNQVDVIALADPSDAPVPATRRTLAQRRAGEHESRVHPTILVRLPRNGSEIGMIPNSAAGHVLYSWLAAFNKTNGEGLAEALPMAVETDAAVVDAELALREQTGGFYLISAKEIQPGLLVFRLRSAKPPLFETLGSLQLRPDANPPAVASFNLRAVPQANGGETAAPEASGAADSR